MIGNGRTETFKGLCGHYVARNREQELIDKDIDRAKSATTWWESSAIDEEIILSYIKC